MSLSSAIGLGLCQVCDKTVLIFSKVQVEDMIWHKKCFNCVICEMELSSETATIWKGKAYCTRHCPKPCAVMFITFDRNRDRSRTEERALAYFHGEIAVQEAERHLEKKGDFLVRWSIGDSCYVVSVKHKTKTHHIRITQIDKGEFFYRKNVFLSLGDWVKRHVDNKFPVFGKNVLLVNPVHRSREDYHSSCDVSVISDSCLNLAIPSYAVPSIGVISSSSLSLATDDYAIFSVPANSDGSNLRRISPRSAGKLQISNDSICTIAADVVVNSIGSNTNLSVGALAKSVAESGGPEIQKDLDAFRLQSVKRPTYGDVIPTGGYNLRSKYVFHTILNGWRGERDTSQDLRKILKKIFQLADEMELKSIAIPPIGTGRLGYHKHVVAQVLYSEAAEYLDSHPDSDISKIIFAVNGEQDLYEIFKKLQEEEERKRPKEETVSSEIVLPNDQNHRPASNYSDIFSYLCATSTCPPSRSLFDEVRSKTIELPKTWNTTENSHKPYDRIELDPNSTEYKDIVANMIVSDGEMHTKRIVKIERIENGKFYMMYELLKELLNRINGNDTASNERLLWHGTTAKAADNIISSGFNKGYCGAHAAVYGKGVYFAVKFSMSARAIYSPAEPPSHLKHVFQCRVLTGNSCLGRKDLVEPDFLPDTSRRCDSAVDVLQDPSIFVTFQDFTAYPEYLISFAK